MILLTKHQQAEHGHDVWLHALLAVVAAYFGFVQREARVAPTRA